MLPDEFTKNMKALLGDEYDAFAASCGEKALYALRMNPLKCPSDAAESILCSLMHLYPDETFKAVPWCPWGFYFTPSDTFRPGRSPYHSAGAYYIQEPSAMAAAVCLDAKPGEIILDLCASPGGKSTQIAAAMQGKGLLVANEIIPARAKILSENIERMGIRNAIVTNESPQRLLAAWPAFFDRILVDAPCSGEGMFRKNPAAADEWSPESAARCAKRQDEILSCAAQMLSPGGRIVYSTCTFAPEENEGTLTRFLSSHPDFTLLPPPFNEKERVSFGFLPGRTDIYPDTPSSVSRAIRIYPHRAMGEGHFIAILQKSGIPPLRKTSDTCNTAPDGSAGKKKKGKKNRMMPKDLSPSAGDFSPERLREFLKDPFSFLSAGGQDPIRFSFFGDQVYLLPAYTPDLTGLKVLRPGLHLGTLKKNRLEPAHALALASSPNESVQSFDLSVDQAALWTAGRTLTVPGDTPSGWTLITVNGYSLGWGKCTGGMMKNHYPKGLRRY